jgi:hypothetical protein
MNEELISVRWPTHDMDWETPNKSRVAYEPPSQNCFSKEEVEEIENEPDGKSIINLKAQCQTICSNLRDIIHESHKSLLSISSVSCSNAESFTHKCTVRNILQYRCSLNCKLSVATIAMTVLWVCVMIACSLRACFISIK